MIVKWLLLRLLGCGAASPAFLDDVEREIVLLLSERIPSLDLRVVFAGVRGHG